MAPEDRSKEGLLWRLTRRGQGLSYSAENFVFPLARLGAPSSLLGTCFAVGPHQVATAHHVVAGDPSGLAMVLPKFRSIQDYQDTTENSFQTVPLTVFAADPIRDLCVLTLGGAEFRGPLRLGSTDQSPVGSLVMTQGYPHANFGRMVLTQQEAKVGARVLLGSGGQKFKNMILNTQAREGQSGGPVIDPGTGLVVAILIGSYAPGGGGGISLGGVDPATLHQTTHAISAEYLQEML
jgi:V8-like Glu-specific endopeptidase